MIDGCLSAASPCNHQKVSPLTICDVCQRSHDLTRTSALERALGTAKTLLEANGYTVTRNPQESEQ